MRRVLFLLGKLIKEKCKAPEIKILDAFFPSLVGAYLVKKQTKSYSSYAILQANKNKDASLHRL